MNRLVLTVVTLAGLALLGLFLAWNHLIPGGWYLHDLIEKPELRERRVQEEHRKARLLEFATGPQEIAPGTLLFIGSSTLERFPLSACFPGKYLLNRGIGGESAALMTQRVEASLPRKGRADLAGAVVYAGSIDFRIERVEVREVVTRVRGLIEALRARTQAELPLLLLGPLPGNEDDDRYRGAAMMRLEEGLRGLAAELGADFLPLAREPFRAAEGGLTTELAADRWHLNDKGYTILAELIRRDGGQVGALLRAE